MPAAHCPICLSHLPINKFVVFPCGHGFCIDCKSCIFQASERPNCPNCRLRIRDRDAHPLFLELVDSKVAFASNLVEGLNKMDHETPLLNVQKAGETLTKVLQDPQAKSNDMTALIKAIENFNERIVPLFTEIEIQTHEIIALRKDSLETRQETKVLQDQLTRAETKSNQLVVGLNEAKKNEKEAIRLAKVAKDDLGRVHESSLHWEKRILELTAENKRQRDMLEKYNESARLQKEKQSHGKLQKQGRHKVAAREKATMSDATGDYDGDFSAHEHSMMRRSLNVMSTSSRYPHCQDENLIGLDMEGIPFLSNWQVNKSSYGAKPSLNPQSTNTRRLTKAVQSRPHSLIHITR